MRYLLLILLRLLWWLLGCKQLASQILHRCRLLWLVRVYLRLRRVLLILLRLVLLVLLLMRYVYLLRCMLLWLILRLRGMRILLRLRLHLWLLVSSLRCILLLLRRSLLCCFSLQACLLVKIGLSLRKFCLALGEEGLFLGLVIAGGAAATPVAGDRAVQSPQRFRASNPIRAHTDHGLEMRYAIHGQPVIHAVNRRFVEALDDRQAALQLRHEVAGVTQFKRDIGG